MLAALVQNQAMLAVADSDTKVGSVLLCFAFFVFLFLRIVVVEVGFSVVSDCWLWTAGFLLLCNFSSNRVGCAYSFVSAPPMRWLGLARACARRTQKQKLVALCDKDKVMAKAALQALSAMVDKYPEEKSIYGTLGGMYATCFLGGLLVDAAACCKLRAFFSFFRSRASTALL